MTYYVVLYIFSYSYLWLYLLLCFSLSLFSFYVSGQLLWGVDRLHFVEKLLGRKGAEPERLAFPSQVIEGERKGRERERERKKEREREFINIRF